MKSLYLLAHSSIHSICSYLKIESKEKNPKTLNFNALCYLCPRIVSRGLQVFFNTFYLSLLTQNLISLGPVISVLADDA